MKRIILTAMCLGLMLALPANAGEPALCCGTCDGDNTATSFEGAWAFRAYDGIHVCWVTGGEHDTRDFAVYVGTDRRERVATVEPKGGENIHFYEVVVPRGYEFEVVEYDNNPATTYSSRVFELGQPPEFLESLRTMNATVAEFAARRPAYPQVRTSTIALASQTVVTDYVFYSSRQDFLDAT